MAPGKIVIRIGLETKQGVVLVDKQLVTPHDLKSRALRESALEILNIASKLSFSDANHFNLNIDKLKSMISKENMDSIITESNGSSCIYIDVDLFNREVYHATNKNVDLKIGRLNVANEKHILELDVPVASVKYTTSDSHIFQLHVMHICSATKDSKTSSFFMQSYIYNGSSVLLNVRNMLRKHVPVDELRIRHGSSHFDMRNAVRSHHGKLMRDLSLCADAEEISVYVTPHSIQCCTNIDTRCGSDDKYQFQTLYLKL
tara:strand:+ start:10089 stop:10865 length:777 start_codon:yes stop_codon:yes gene_type:complete